jgi:hypothetical protein
VQVFFGFAPWIAFMVLSSNNTFELAAVIALVIALVVFLISRRSGSKPTAFDYATLGFFALLVIVGLFVSDAAVATWVQPVSNFALLTIALVSILIGKPLPASTPGSPCHLRCGIRRASSRAPCGWRGCGSRRSPS